MAPSERSRVHPVISSFHYQLFVPPERRIASISPTFSSFTQSMWLILRGRYRTNSCRINWMESLAPRQQRDVQSCSLSPCLMFPSANFEMIFKGRGGTYTWKMSWNRSPRESVPLAADWGGGVGWRYPSSEGNPRVNTEWIWRHLAASSQPGTCLRPTPSTTINHRFNILAPYESIGWGQKLVWWEDAWCPPRCFFSFWEFSLLQLGWDDKV